MNGVKTSKKISLGDITGKSDQAICNLYNKIAFPVPVEFLYDFSQNI